MPYILLFTLLALTACISSTPEESTESPISSPETISSSSITVSSSSESGCIKYDRDLYNHWIDEDGDCQDTRDEILNSQNLNGKTDNCEVTEGKWLDPYSNQYFNDPSEIDIDHIIPLAEAHRSGAYSWTNEKREMFANSEGNLTAVSASENRSKGDRDPANWMSSDSTYHQGYIRIWIENKVEFGLTADSAELRAIKEILGDDTLVTPVLKYPELAEEVECTGVTGFL